MFSFYNKSNSLNNDESKLSSKDIQVNLKASLNNNLERSECVDNDSKDFSNIKDIRSLTNNDIFSKTKVNSTSSFNDLQKARQDLIGEIQAIIEYDKNAKEASDRLAQITWQGIKNEELAHVGELLALIDYLDETQRQYVEKGVKEFNEIMKNKQ